LKLSLNICEIDANIAQLAIIIQPRRYGVIFIS
jgi:hypothetical protein